MHSQRNFVLNIGFGRSPTSIFEVGFEKSDSKIARWYRLALLATTMKPLNALPRFENHFAIETVRFQVQLEADGYFSVQEIFAFAIVASRASWYQLAIF